MIKDDLNDLYDREVLPVFAGIGLGDAAQAYRGTVIERFMNPFLDHFLADIFTNHAAKKRRRFGGLIELKRRSGTRPAATAPGGGAGRRRMTRSSSQEACSGQPEIKIVNPGRTRPHPQEEP